MMFTEKLTDSYDGINNGALVYMPAESTVKHLRICDIINW
ncbi:hypothetical protein NEF87_002386 [Candidatus Lokiarchaeum ossiferum]|uniref:Uncharacterized protein n=1 Tax=Candidatus Lokiarchaeum ossiferum TaxID=2951803 RepID=A0ABY6HRQ1_9ARCH|nr:hypothetical protein NEF87_002386 [Candidatus Lokiarchaeum sp. B-35]